MTTYIPTPGDCLACIAELDGNTMLGHYPGCDRSTKTRVATHTEPPDHLLVSIQVSLPMDNDGNIVATPRRIKEFVQAYALSVGLDIIGEDYPEPTQRYSGGIWLGEKQLNWTDLERCKRHFASRNAEKAEMRRTLTERMEHHGDSI